MPVDRQVMQAPATIETAPAVTPILDNPVLDDALRLTIPGKTSRERHTVVQRLLLPPLFVAPACLDQPERIGRLLQLWRGTFGAGDAVQLILPVWPGPDHIDRAIAAVQDASAAGGVDLDVLAEMVLTTVPGKTIEDIAGVASARACWIALDGQEVPAGSGFTPLLAEPDALRAAAQTLAPGWFAGADSQATGRVADGAA
jgi:hypothetical protein